MHLYWVTWNVVITYISRFHKMLVKGLVTMVLYSSGKTGKWKEESNFPVSSKEMEYAHFHLQNPLFIRSFRHFCVTFCRTASGHNIFLLLLSFSVKILLVYEDQEKLDMGWEVWEKMYDEAVNTILLRPCLCPCILGFMISLLFQISHTLTSIPNLSSKSPIFGRHLRNLITFLHYLAKQVLLKIFMLKCYKWHYTSVGKKI